MNELAEWLLEGQPWVQYRTRLDLLGQPEDAPQVFAARQAMMAHPQIQGLLAELAEWPWPILRNHKDASHPVHKLTFIADLGFKVGDPGIDQIVEHIMAHQAPEGPFQVLANISPRYGGTGEDQWVWMLCDAPLILYALLKFGLERDPRVQTALHCLAGLIRENGWPCAVAPEVGRFRGPGRKTDPCPYATLAMLKALSQTPQCRDGEDCRTGTETLLSLWTQRRERRPYMFAMGTDFAKLKAPMIWYDILHVLDTLTQFPWLRKDTRLQEMVAVLEEKADEEGRFACESVWRAWEGWEFAQKRVPCRWLTLLVQRIFKRIHV